MTLLDAGLFDRPLLALDLEMTGLNPRRDRILSIGCVPVTREGIPLGQAQHWLLRSSAPVADSARVHHLRDMDVAQGLEPGELLPPLLQQWHEQVLITHGGDLDSDFLQRAHRYYLGKAWRPMRLDTQVFARRRLQPDQTHNGSALSLRRCRANYRLPPWRAHHALSDAIATAELFLAQLQDAFPRQANPPWPAAYKSFSDLFMRWGWR